MDELKELVAKLDYAYHDRLVSVVLYGSGAAGNHDPNFSDLNVLCVLKEITPARTGRGRAGDALVARTGPSLAAADDGRGSAQLRR